MDFSKIKEQINKILNNRDKKKSRDLLITLLILGVVIIIAANVIFSGSKKTENVSPSQDDKYVAAAKLNSSEDKDEISKKLETILSKIQGAGNVSVMITYAGSKETVPAYDTKTNKSDTQEKDSTGGTRNQGSNNNESQVVFEESTGGTKKPVVLKEISPEIKGVLIVSEGASNGVVYESLIKATQVVLDIPLHKIQVAQKGK
jgi:stage III sporulation protein AG